MRRSFTVCIMLQTRKPALVALDPYQLCSEAWVDDPSLWPEVEFPHIYVYLIDTPGEFTREKLKAFKSLEAYNYYIRYCFYDRGV